MLFFSAVFLFFNSSNVFSKQFSWNTYNVGYPFRSFQGNSFALGISLYQGRSGIDGLLFVLPFALLIVLMICRSIQSHKLEILHKMQFFSSYFSLKRSSFMKLILSIMCNRFSPMQCTYNPQQQLWFAN